MTSLKLEELITQVCYSNASKTARYCALIIRHLKRIYQNP